MSAPSFDVVVVGGGPGGYTAAVRAAKKGSRVALVEERALGGTCLNVGCIPTKALLASAKLLHAVSSRAAQLGLVVPEARMDFTKVMARKDRVVMRLVRGLQALFAKHQITVISGRASYAGGHEVIVNGEPVGFSRLIWAGGSAPRVLPGIPFGGRVISSTEALSLTSCPSSMIMIGGGVVGIELATFYAIAGARVTVVEMQPEILPGTDPEAARLVRAGLERMGVSFLVGTTVKEVRCTEGSATALCSDGIERSADYVLNAVGRQLDLSALQGSGIAVTPKGAVRINERCETSVPDVYAVGDVTGVTWLAHGASYQGEVAAENAAGSVMSADYHAVPACIFSLPEIASVGVTVVDPNVHTVVKVPLSVLGKMQADAEADGFLKLIKETASGMVRGVTIVGPHASDLLAEGTLSVALGLKDRDLAHVIRPHPTLSEIFSEAYLQVHC